MSSFERKIVIVTDVFSTGAVLAAKLDKAGCSVVACLSTDLGDLLNMIPCDLRVNYLDTITYDTTKDPDTALNEMINKIRALEGQLVAVIAGAETGVLLADRLSEKLGLRTNETSLSDARRNKFIMGETVRAANIRAVKQVRCTLWEEIDICIKEWNLTLNSLKLIVKPLDSAGSDSVTLCNNIDDVKEAFNNIMGKSNGLGLKNEAILVQEYLEGTEYVIDAVSRDGDHKIIAIWEYDRRPVNGADFVCFGQRLMTIDEDRAQEIVDYQKKVPSSISSLIPSSSSLSSGTNSIKYFKRG